MKKSSSQNVEDCSSDNQGPLSDKEPLSPCISSYTSSLGNSEPFSYTPDNLTDHFDETTDELWPVTYFLRITIGDKRQIMDRCSLNVNDKKVVQVLPLNAHHYFAITNLELGTEEKKPSAFLILALSFPTVKWITI